MGRPGSGFWGWFMDCFRRCLPGSKPARHPRRAGRRDRDLEGSTRAGRPEYLLYEEIAHHIAGEDGLPPDGNAGIFLQELFAGFVKFSLVQEHDPQLSHMRRLPLGALFGPSLRSAKRS